MNLSWEPASPVFPLARAVGLRVADWQDVILVNQVGKRFYDETQGQYDDNNYDRVKDSLTELLRIFRDVLKAAQLDAGI